MSCTGMTDADVTRSVPYRPGRLQRAILDIALRNRELEGRTGCEKSGADILYTEAVIEDINCQASIRDQRGQRIYSDTVFTLGKIGKAEYLSARASVSASMRNLERRGLVVTVKGMTGWLGANLTEEGVRLAQRIRVARSNRQDRRMNGRAVKRLAQSLSENPSWANMRENPERSEGSLS